MFARVRVGRFWERQQQLRHFFFPKDLFSNLLNLLSDGIPNLKYAKYDSKTRYLVVNNVEIVRKRQWSAR